MAKFAKGDLVQLKPGQGPQMVVTALDDGDEVYCQWYVGETLHQEWLDAVVLVKADNDE